MTTTDAAFDDINPQAPVHYLVLPNAMSRRSKRWGGGSALPALTIRGTAVAK